MQSNFGLIAGWVFGILFSIIGILNVILVHPVPGLFYIVLSLIYLPPISTLIEEKLSLSISTILKIILGIAVMWATLGVGDLMEIFEAWILK